LEKILISNFMKIRPVGTDLFRAGGETDRQTDERTDITKLTAALRHFANVPEDANKVKVKGKAMPLQAWRGPEGSRRLSHPDFKTIGT
jgi:hypothetical protein